ncbi:MAG: DNA mismatch repair protein MutS [Alteromonas naphthalenivorans]|jgi:DNA mismatch repair protein MutS
MRMVKTVFLGFLSFLLPFFLFSHDRTLLDTMARDNLRTIMNNSLEEENTLNSLIKKNKKFYEVLETTLKQQQHLSPEKKRRLAFSLLSDYEKEYPTTHSTVLDKTSWQDLEILSGPKSNLSHYLAAKLDRTLTEIGRITLFKKLITPQSNPDCLATYQAIVKEFVFNENLFLDIDHHLNRLKESENIILSLWEEDIFESILKQSALSIPYAPETSEWIDRSSNLVEFANVTRLVSLVGTNTYMAVGALSLPAQGIAQLMDSRSYPEIKNFNETWGLGAMSILSVTGLFFYVLKKRHDNKYIDAFSNIISGPFGGVNVLYLDDHLRNESAFKKGLQTKLIAAAQYIDALKQLSLTTQNNPLLVQKFPAIITLTADLDVLSKKSSEIKQLLGLLETSTFKGKPRLFSLYGRMYVAYKLLGKIKHEFVPFMITAGELDVYLSCSKLIKEFKSERVDFCFPQYIITSNQPFITAEYFWNPAISPQKVVPSSLTINKETGQNIIVTGPNAGGKSTVIKGLIVNVIMSQSLGIAAAQSFTLTPFTNIMTYLNITDDIAAGNSHFKAGVLRARELIETAKKQNYNQFSFTAVDEVFNGTTFKEGQAAAYSLIEHLGSYTNNICVTVTHFPKITRLEERTDHFSNYKVTVQKNNSGRIMYPYKLEPGISHQAIALDILKQEGFDDTFLNKAQEILNETDEG